MTIIYLIYGFFNFRQYSRELYLRVKCRDILENVARKLNLNISE